MTPQQAELTYKILGGFFAILMAFNFIFFFLGRIKTAQFWFITILCAIMGFWVIPKLRARMYKK